MSTPSAPTEELIGSKLKKTQFPVLSNNEVTLPNGFTSAVVTNDGDINITITNTSGATYALKPKEVMRWDHDDGYLAINVDSSGGGSGRIAYTM